MDGAASFLKFVEANKSSSENVINQDGHPKTTNCRPPVNQSTPLPDLPRSTLCSVAFSISVNSSENLFTRFSCYCTPVSHIGSILLPDTFIYPSPVLNIITKPRLQTSSLTTATIITTLALIAMEDSTVPPTTTTTTTNLYYHEQPRIVRNPQRSNMVCAQNDQNFSINEVLSSASASVTSHSHFHQTPYSLHSYNQTLQFQLPCAYLHEHVVPLVFPAYSYRVEGSGMGTRVTNLSLRGFPDRLFSNGHLRDMVQRTCSMRPLGLAEFQQQRKLHSLVSKAARSKRKMARQRSANLQINYSSSSLPSSSTISKPSACAASQKGDHSDQKDLYTFCTPDNKKLRFLLHKMLSSSDVGTLGRIILPKRAAEGNLPSLSSKEGIPMVVRDVYSTQEWKMRYRFWSNYKGRIYILDQTGDFVKQNGLEIGDYLILYEDQSKNLYFSSRKTEKPTPKPSNEPTNTYYSYFNTPFSQEDEEDSSLKILVEELKHTEQAATNSLLTLYTNNSPFNPQMGGSQEPR